jgi:hypothetical protein
MPESGINAPTEGQPGRRGTRAIFRRLFGAARRIYHRAGQAEARAIMSGFYFVALGTVALVMGRRRKALLISPGEPIAWRSLQERAPSDHSAKQY